VYGQQTLALLAFVAQARRLGFHLDEIKEVVQIKRSGRCPCPHVLDLVRQKVEELDRTLADLTEVRHGLQEILRSSARSMQRGKAVVCHHIERLKLVKGRR
jgi:MerR family transcriptional regulator, copper efflux regulator